MWHKVAELDELPDGRVKTVHRRPHAASRSPACGDALRRARQPLPAPGRPARRGLDREGLLRCPWHGYDYDPLTGTPPPGFTDAPGVLPGRGARRRRLRRARRPSAPHERTVSDVMVETMVDVGRHPRVRHGRPLEPRLRRRDARARGARRPHVHRHPPRGRGRVRGVGLRQAHRPAGRVLRDRRARLHQPAHRALRRQGRPRAGARASRARCRRRCSAAARSRTSTSPPRSPTSPATPRRCSPTPTTPS